MVLQFARHLEGRWREERGIPDVEVRARVLISLNGRRPALHIDPERDLTEVEWGIRPADWILPLNVPLRSWDEFKAQPGIRPAEWLVLLKAPLVRRGE